MGRENRTLGTHSGGLLGSRGGGGGRLLEGQQKKVPNSNGVSVAGYVLVGLSWQETFQHM